MRHPASVVLLIFLAGCGRTGPASPDPLLDALPADCAQTIVVRPVDGKLVDVVVSAFERIDGRWQPAFPPLAGTVGKNGITSAEMKREGDGCTPAGIYSIGPAFGYADSCQTGLTYRQATANDFWVDDAESPEYNRWVVGMPNAKSFELMRRADDLYEIGAVIRYNTDPVVPGKGSAIFLHVWPGPGRPTAGCVALEKAHVGQLLVWLKGGANPRMIIAER